MVVGGSQEETLDPGFVLLRTRQQGVPIILRKLVLLDGFVPVSPSFMVIGGNRQETKDSGFVLHHTCQQGVPIILEEIVLLDGFYPVSTSFTVRDVTTELSGLQTTCFLSTTSNHYLIFNIIHPRSRTRDTNSVFLASNSIHVLLQQVHKIAPPSTIVFNELLSHNLIVTASYSFHMVITSLENPTISTPLFCYHPIENFHSNECLFSSFKIPPKN
ncbi:unnamed protein product [Schistosoma curassoni]|uniref:MMS1_N domain-containing protein n=1 Tax=Schistosoma curassoni TaxID=6186 RepID=A0A183KC63_9TREM|nr:unnamed protein product [Schistosoma curassoni]